MVNTCFQCNLKVKFDTVMTCYIFLISLCCVCKCRIFDSPNDDLSNSKITNSEFKNKPDGWETTSKTQDGNIWEMSQREEDILVQEFERRIAFNKFQVCGEIPIYEFKLSCRADLLSLVNPLALV